MKVVRPFIFHQPLECFQQRRLSRGIERASRLIENQIGSVLEQCARDGNPLAIATRKGSIRSFVFRVGLFSSFGSDFAKAR